MGAMNEAGDELHLLPLEARPEAEPPVLRVEGDCLRLVFGEASIELHRDGRIVLRGTHIASYSTGANKIRGATIELN